MAEKKDGTFIFRLTDSDREKLFKNAENAGTTASEYLRGIIHNRSPARREDYILIKELINSINAVGNNINQIAKNFNSGFFDESEKKELVKLMEELVGNTEQIIRDKRGET